MTLQSPPSYLQSGSYPAQYDRITTQAVYATTGVIGTTSLNVTQNSPAGMSVIASSGWAAIVGTTVANMGTYLTYNDANEVLTVTTADPTLPRIDRVVVTVRDAFYSGAFNDVIFQVLAGTPASSPVAPAIPANSISLATIAVGAAVTSITNANITDTRPLVTSNIPFVSNVATSTIAGTSYTLQLSDAQKLLLFSNASPIAVSIPLNSTAALPVGTQINIVQNNTGQVTVSGVGGVTVTSTGASTAAPKTRTAYSVLTAIQTSANNWLITGDIV